MVEIYLCDINSNFYIVLRTAYIYQNPMHAWTIVICLFVSIFILKYVVHYNKKEWRYNNFVGSYEEDSIKSFKGRQLDDLGSRKGKMVY